MRLDHRNSIDFYVLRKSYVHITVWGYCFNQIQLTQIASTNINRTDQTTAILRQLSHLLTIHVMTKLKKLLLVKFVQTCLSEVSNNFFFRFVTYENKHYGYLKEAFK